MIMFTYLIRDEIFGSICVSGQPFIHRIIRKLYRNRALEKWSFCSMLFQLVDPLAKFALVETLGKVGHRRTVFVESNLKITNIDQRWMKGMTCEQRKKRTWTNASSKRLMMPRVVAGMFSSFSSNFEALPLKIPTGWNNFSSEIRQATAWIKKSKTLGQRFRNWCH